MPTPQTRRNRRKRLLATVLTAAGPEVRCAYCEDRLAAVELTLDHVRPLALGGAGDSANLAPAHKRCNALKGAIAPDVWARLLPLLRAAGYFAMTRAERRAWRRAQPLWVSQALNHSAALRAAAASAP